MTVTKLLPFPVGTKGDAEKISENWITVSKFLEKIITKQMTDSRIITYIPTFSHKSLRNKWSHTTWLKTSSNFWDLKNNQDLMIIANYLDQASEYILSLPDNWNDDGGKQFEKSTMEKVIVFIIELYSHAISNGFELPKPKIYPYEEGSIEIQIKNEKIDLLANIQENEDIILISLDNYKSKLFEAQIETSDVLEVLIPWLELILKPKSSQMKIISSDG